MITDAVVVVNKLTGSYGSAFNNPIYDDVGALEERPESDPYAVYDDIMVLENKANAQSDEEKAQ